MRRFIERFHGSYVHTRRVGVLCDRITDFMPENVEVLDVGCGDGLLAHLIMQKRRDVNIRGIDVLVRSEIYIPVEAFDGRLIPYVDKTFDVVMFVDVLHHTQNPTVLLQEALRVARATIVIKDHTCEGLFDSLTLRFMDRVSNSRHGVALPFNYWPQHKWLETFDRLGLTVTVWEKKLGLYPPPADWIFDRSLHFIARLDLDAGGRRLLPAALGSGSARIDRSFSSDQHESTLGN